VKFRRYRPNPASELAVGFPFDTMTGVARLVWSELGWIKTRSSLVRSGIREAEALARTPVRTETAHAWG
jgi:hypothetical protein